MQIYKYGSRLSHTCWKNSSFTLNNVCGAYSYSLVKALSIFVVENEALSLFVVENSKSVLRDKAMFFCLCTSNGRQ